MTIEELEKDLKTGELQNIYLLYGEEQYLLEQDVKKIKKNFGELVNGINYIRNRLEKCRKTNTRNRNTSLCISKKTNYYKRFWAI